MHFIPSEWCPDIVQARIGKYFIYVFHVMLVIKDEILYYWRRFIDKPVEICNPQEKFEKLEISSLWSLTMEWLISQFPRKRKNVLRCKGRLEDETFS